MTDFLTTMLYKDSYSSATDTSSRDVNPAVVGGGRLGPQYLDMSSGYRFTRSVLWGYKCTKFISAGLSQASWRSLRCSSSPPGQLGRDIPAPHPPPHSMPVASHFRHLSASTFGQPILMTDRCHWLQAMF